MTRLSAWKMAGAAFVCAATAIAAQGQVFNSLLSFDGTDGLSPYNVSLVQGRDGSYYGTTSYGGGNNLGTIFRITSDGTLTTLYSFCDQDYACPDGSEPLAGLIQDIDGDLYGTTYSGGTQNSGTIFRITPQGVLNTVYNFCSQINCTDGYYPEAGLIQAVDGNFYGSTILGGNSACGKGNGCGTIFRITPEAALTTMHAFGGSDGSSPSGLVQAANGDFYGTTSGGGAQNEGTVFKISAGGTLTTLHNFCERKDCADGGQPWASLMLGPDENLYGTTTESGAHNAGTAFRITPSGRLTILYTFCSLYNCNDGASPTAGLIQGTDGQLYGATDYLGAGHSGTLFSISSDRTLTIQHSFDENDGFEPFAALLQATNGTFYGITLDGGKVGGGTVYSLSTGLGPFVSFVRAAGRVGQTGPILGQGFTGTTSVYLNGIPANFTVVSDTFIKATVPAGATTGYVTVTTPTGTLTSNVPFHVIP
jgi:uncharacterized repeat protein (TIGR03803 family)